MVMSHSLVAVMEPCVVLVKVVPVLIMVVDMVMLEMEMLEMVVDMVLLEMVVQCNLSYAELSTAEAGPGLHLHVEVAPRLWQPGNKLKTQNIRFLPFSVR